MIETNTFGANHTKLQAIGLESRVRAINRKGAELARRAAGDRAFVAGSVGPLVRIKGDERELSVDEMTAIFREQCEALADGGADLFILETFSDLNQLRCAVTAARGTGLPVVASMAFLEGGRSAAGVEVERAAMELSAAGADLLGANCGAGPLEVLATVKRLAAASSLPVAAFANSGFPEYVDGRSIYRATPDYFAAMARIEQRMKLTETPDDPAEPVSQEQREQLLEVAQKLEEPELGYAARLELATVIRVLLGCGPAPLPLAKSDRPLTQAPP